ncbi:MAG: dGTPase [Rickettsiales bacterium]|jgi:dGTPase
MLSKFASFSQNSQGRLHKESDGQFRSIYGRDRDRIINSNAFRRLQYKTQVFVNHEGDHYRTRLTHSLEVAQIARWIASGLDCNKDLAEVVSLAHDLGHTPFGHAGEDSLAAKMQDFGGFSHNAHALKLITKLEQSYLAFDGLNLSWEMLEGVVKHNGAIKDVSKVHDYIGQYNKNHDLDLSRSPSIEAQISAISDDIAYNNHDIEDGIRAELFRIEDLLDLPFIGNKFREVLQQKPKARIDLLVSEAKKRIVNDMVLDVIFNTKSNIEKHKINNSEDVRDCDFFLAQFSSEIEIAHQEIKKFLHKNMYRHYKVNRMSASAEKIVSGLFDFFIQNHNCLPAHHQISSNDKKELAINVSDYIAGMTDRFAISEYQKLLTI